MMRAVYGDMQPGSAYRDSVRAAERRGRSICETCDVEFTPKSSSAGRFCSVECYHASIPRPDWWVDVRATYPSSPEGMVAEMRDALARLEAYVAARDRADGDTA